jgi:transketolase
MGATHHALEDYGALLCLPHLRVYIPAFDGDLREQIGLLFDTDHPAYLRLGLSEEPKDMPLPGYASWRKLLSGGGATLVVVGPLVGGILNAARQLPERQRPDLWLACELPLTDVPADLRADLRRSGSLIVIEEHVAQGGAGRMLAQLLLEVGEAPRRFAVRTALGYPSGLYGSQKFHRKECGLDAEALLRLLTEEGAA